LDIKNSIRKEKVIHGKIKRSIYIFLCKCGKKMKVRSDAVKKHPGHCLKCAHRKRPYESLYNSLVQTAKRRNLKIKITYKQFLKFTKIKNCHYCGSNLFWEEFTTYKANKKQTNLDRVNNDKGYVIKNCVVCCFICNRAKLNLTATEFLNWVERLKKWN
jgi:hypothetical protein